MSKQSALDQTFHIIVEKMIASGQAPQYAEIAAALGVSPEEGRKLLRKLFSTLGFPGWLDPKSDDVMSFAPFNHVPTNYRLTIDGIQKWYGQ